MNLIQQAQAEREARAEYEAVSRAAVEAWYAWYRDDGDEGYARYESERDRAHAALLTLRKLEARPLS